MLVTSTTLWLPKDGNSSDEYEDAAYPQSCSDASGLTEFHCAVADGATETSFSGLWAELLVRGYTDGEPLKDSRKKWQEKIPSSNQAWYVEEKAQAGAYAALVGLSLHAHGAWGSEAVGDSCLLHIRAGRIIQSFPLESAEEFNNRPALICSIKNASSEVETSILTGQWKSGDRFLLLTDAIARWLLEQRDSGIKRIWRIENEAELRAFTDEQRAIMGADGRSKLHNDDITIMKVEVN